MAFENCTACRLACVRVDIDESTLYRWLTAGETQVRGRYCEFRKDFQRAIAESAETLLNQIRVKAHEDWRAAAFILERRFPDDYGKRTEVTGKGGGPMKVETKSDRNTSVHSSKGRLDVTRTDPRS